MRIAVTGSIATDHLIPYRAGLPTSWSPVNSTGCPCRSSRTLWRSAGAASRRTSPSASAVSACARCWSGRREPTSPAAPLAADPSQQLARLDAGETRRLVDGARLLFTNEYEAALLQQRTGWRPADILDRVGTWVTTLGPEVRPSPAPASRHCASPPSRRIAPLGPTGAGDAFRAGFLAGVTWGVTSERAAQLGCALATVVRESVGTQEYETSAADLSARTDKAYGPAAGPMA